MKRKITYKQRLLYVLIAGGVFLLVLYNLALSDTISLAFDNEVLKEQIEKNQGVTSELKKVKKQLATIKQVIGNEHNEQMDIHQMLLELITAQTQKNNMILKDFPQPYALTDKGYLTKTVQATLEGGFVDLLQLVYFLENNYKGGKVVAVDFKTIKQRRTRKRKLNSVIYLQNVKAEKNEKNS